MLYIILIVILVIFVIFFVIPTAAFYILFKTKYKNSFTNDNLSEMMNFWINKFTNNNASSFNQVKSVEGSDMSINEALEVLNISNSDNLTKKDVNTYYYALMQKLHPDKGGSNYLAKKLNEARAVLLKIAK